MHIRRGRAKAAVFLLHRRESPASVEAVFFESMAIAPNSPEKAALPGPVSSIDHRLMKRPPGQDM
ncbi:hypothetical protein [Herbaspirillum sp. SJZ099]|uniref:hypothetical protein n=1 Tax=Herbaspirillum sp. SJZ099 TaxID=2572916 RepID=UPI001647D6F6|nr:hypothetical protein [Herbaspirillum sp. SJZ099]